MNHETKSFLNHIQNLMNFFKDKKKNLLVDELKYRKRKYYLLYN